MMGNWKFLLQKKGDRGFLPAGSRRERTSSFWRELKTQSVEIEEGKYRLLGQSNYVSSPVEICLNHRVNPGEPISSYSFKHYRKTNERGLIEICSFFDFVPGIWELSCRSDVFSEILGESWQENLQLKVLKTRESEESELLKTTKQIDLFFPDRGKIKNRQSIALVGQILPPKICDSAQTPTVIKLPSIEYKN
jgi:hypothetical protein